MIVRNFLSGVEEKPKSTIYVTGLNSTDTVYATSPSGNTLTPTWDGARFVFNVDELGSYTITASNGTKTKTETVLVDEVGEYTVPWEWVLWLYKDGDEEVEFNIKPNQGSLTKGDTYLTLKCPVNGEAQMQNTSHPLDTTAFSKICVQIKDSQSVRFYCGQQHSASQAGWDKIDYIDSGYKTGERLGQVSTYANTANYITIGFVPDNKSSVAQAYISRIWLE